MNTSANSSMNATASTTSAIDLGSGFIARNIVIATSVAILILAAFVGNIIVVVSFTMFRNLRTMTNYFLVSLALSDILVAVFVMPVFLLLVLYQPRNFFAHAIALRKMWKIMDIGFCFTSVCSLCAIAIERNLAISHPFYYTKLMSPLRVYLTIAFIWVFSLTVAILVNHDDITIDIAKHLSVFVAVVSYFIPLLIILVMYMKIWRVARRQAKRLRQDGALATDFKAIKTIAIVIGTFFVCYTPQMISIFWIHFRVKPYLPNVANIMIKWITYFNCCVNPVIYSCFNKTYRNGFKKLFAIIKTRFRDLRTRSSDKRSRKISRSRISLNITLRTSVGSLLDSSKLPPSMAQARASNQQRCSVLSTSQNMLSPVDKNDNHDCCSLAQSKQRKESEVFVNISAEDIADSQQ